MVFGYSPPVASVVRGSFQFGNPQVADPHTQQTNCSCVRFVSALGKVGICSSAAQRLFIVFGSVCVCVRACVEDPERFQLERVLQGQWRTNFDALSRSASTDVPIRCRIGERGHHFAALHGSLHTCSIKHTGDHLRATTAMSRMVFTDMNQAPDSIVT